MISFIVYTHLPFHPPALTTSCVASNVSLCLTCIVGKLHVYPQEIDE
jgi:hypothetical protein